jgi:hypothetical protein
MAQGKAGLLLRATRWVNDQNRTRTVKDWNKDRDLHPGFGKTTDQTICGDAGDRGFFTLPTTDLYGRLQGFFEDRIVTGDVQLVAQQILIS